MDGFAAQTFFETKVVDKFFFSFLRFDLGKKALWKAYLIE